MKTSGWIIAAVCVIVGALFLYLAGTGMNQGPMMGMTAGMNITMISAMLVSTLFVGALVIGLIASIVALVNSRAHQCKYCNHRVRSEWHTCPYCGTPIPKGK